MRHVDLAKPEVTEAAVIDLPVQSVKMFMKAPRYSQTDLKAAGVACVSRAKHVKIFPKYWHTC